MPKGKRPLPDSLPCCAALKRLSLSKVHKHKHYPAWKQIETESLRAYLSPKKHKNMCLAIPGKIKSIEMKFDGTVRMAQIDFGGITKEASLEMIPKAQVGDYVLVHVGVAISIVNEEEAKRTFRYLEEMGEVEEELNIQDRLPDRSEYQE